MGRLIIVSNRLPASLVTEDDGSYTLRQSVGGLATAIGPYHKAHHDSLWVGWSGIEPEDRSEEELEKIRDVYKQNRCVPIFLSHEDVAGYYEGFANDTLWPLLHDFSHEAVFDPETWETYQSVNRQFMEALTPLVRKGDTIWIQDYHLMLLPGMLRKRFPNASIGWFLHVPFPSVEIFRTLPWNKEILEGVLGADLIGFHTVDYAINFEANLAALLDMKPEHGRVTLESGHVANIDAFPIGIDYNLYKRTASSSLSRSMRFGIERACGKRTTRHYQSSLLAEGHAAAEAERAEKTWWGHFSREEAPELELAQSALSRPGEKPNKVVVSVDRLDYTKGIPERLRAFERLLEKYPEWIGHVTYYLLATPSRESVGTYQKLKEQVDQLIGQINGKYSLLAWTPIHYITRSLPIKPVCGIYAAGDVALVTPLRDGMNLVAKEYLACHDGRDGALVLSEMAGAAAELSEAFIVNPYDTEALCDALHEALEISPEESRRRNIAMQTRLKFRTAGEWCAEFLDGLDQVTRPALADKRLRMLRRNEIRTEWDSAKRKLVLCDYDGTLTPLVRTPDRARPTPTLHTLLRRLGSEPGVDLVLVSGRDRDTMERWFGDLPVGLIAEHGAWRSDRPLGEPAGAGDSASQPSRSTRTWIQASGMPDAHLWQPLVEGIMQESVSRVPRSFIERKSDALAWHYRLSEPKKANPERKDLTERLRPILEEWHLEIMENAKVLEVCPASISKGEAVAPLVEGGTYDIVVATGDDTTDETMFDALPDTAWTFKIGGGDTAARYRLPNPASMRRMLGNMITESDAAESSSEANYEDQHPQEGD
ncbi:MAG: bifunctional alpha,alpha-trehalose-phosphate synthase (UDP-forming)/trehalose-phosphatase [Bifidobacteriaceae bacterium]|jgi:trehalose 6-phosphate synthase/phosphatase|nr:bifunctional alpha,alpha-trehalose-phosphate synthase (UDP-forming)/trehalose-phosphatase [Bifidobacteriaceae bacterium]